MRNFFYTIMEFLKKEFPNKLLIVYNAHFNAIATTMQLCFGISSNIDQKNLLDRILNGYFGEIDNNNLSFVKSGKLSVNYLNISLLCIINTIGIKCQIEHDHTFKQA